MNDEFDALRAALKAAPAPDAQAKADAIALAMKNFESLQGSAPAARSNSDHPETGGIWKRIGMMLKGISSRQALAGTASVAAICVAVVLVGGDLRRPVISEAQPEVKEAVGAVENATALDGEVQPAPKPVAPVTELAAPEAAVTAPADAPVVAQESVDADAVVAADPAPEPVMETAEAEAPAALAPAPSGGQGGVAITGEARMGISGGNFFDSGTTDGRQRAEAAGEVLYLEEAPAPDELARKVANSGIVADQVAPLEPNTEAFANEVPNPVKVTAEEPVSTFSIDVDTASYAVVRNSLNMGYLPPPEAVRIEEMVNYFPYDYAAPTAEDGAFKSNVTVMQTPWNAGTRLVSIGIQGAMPETDARPPLNLVFLIDTSGSMEDANKLPLLVQSFQLMLGQLRPQDQVAIVTYAGSAGVVLEPTAASDVAKISAALNNLAAGGSTAGAEGLELAYQIAAGMGADGEVSRVLLATDGDFNVGVSDPEGLEAYVAKKRETGIYLSVLGFGRGNLDDAIMQSLAQNGNGTAAYIDTLNEARKVLVDQLTGALFPIADDVKIQVEWNPAAVTEYRLIGYETRALAREDFNNDKVDAGEIGAGVQVTAIYEVVPFGSPARLNDPLRYGGAEVVPQVPAAEMGFLRLRSKAPGAAESTLKETPIPNAVSENISEDARFAASIAGFGQLLTGAKYLGDWGWDEAIALALESRGEDTFGYRIEAVNLMRMGKTLSGE
jgi:Ca-activated chloride channel homolog